MSTPYDHEEVSTYLQEVTEQIQYKPVRKAIQQELANHLADSVYDKMDHGATEQEAMKSAITAMGDGVSVGLALNDTYTLQKDNRLNMLVAILLSFGFIWNIFSDNPSNIRILPYILGIGVLYWIIESGYKLFIQKRNYVIAVFVSLTVFLMLIDFFRFKISSFTTTFYIGWISDILDTIIYHIWISTVSFSCFLFLPIFALLLYKGRHNGIKGILVAYLPIWIPAFLWYTDGENVHSISGKVMMIIIVIISMCFAINKGFFSMQKKYLLPIHMCCIMIALFLSVIVSPVCARVYYEKTTGIIYEGNENPFQKNFELMFTPEKNVTNRLDDAFDEVKLKALLPYAKWFGEADLSKEELMSYGSGSFFFSEKQTEEESKYLSFELSNVTLEKILPQYYHKNYRIAYIILKYGKAAGILFLFSIILLIAIVFKNVLAIQNSIGFIVSIVSATTISVQIIFYVLGNFGFLFGCFPVLPFVTDGMASIIINMFFLGTIMAAYRYDRVIAVEIPEINYLDQIW